MNRVLAKGNKKALCSIDQGKIDNFTKTERELDGLKKTLALLENVY